MSKYILYLAIIGIILASFMLGGAVSYSFVVAAPEQPVTAAPPTVEACEKKFMAGEQPIYKCVDDEPPWAVCYQPEGGVMQCVKE